MFARRQGEKTLDDGRSEALSQRLSNRTIDNAGFWAFSDLKSRSGSHALFQYPAMMVPELQGALLDDLLTVDDSLDLVYDPFAGSGTVMLESLYRGLSFHGSDINPLAILLCEVKANPPEYNEALHQIDSIVESMSHVKGWEKIYFPNVEKWFKECVLEDLSKLRYLISKLSDLKVRRFLWICLSETVRMVSNSRISTFKLHAYSMEDTEKRVIDTVGVFKAITYRNASRLDQHWHMMEKISSQGKNPKVKLFPGSVSNGWIAPERADVLMTSPPYGDNKTTVPYGQHSYLPLRCICTSDIPGGFDDSLLESTSKIDTLSLGGLIRGADSFKSALCSSSSSFDRFLSHVDEVPSLRKKVLSFTYDYMMSLSTINKRLKYGAFCFYTLGERRVGGEVFPLVDITKELLMNEGHEFVTVIKRILPGSKKRMALKNSSVETMASEWILVTRSWGGENA